jgi:hypothetical protein
MSSIIRTRIGVIVCSLITGRDYPAPGQTITRSDEPAAPYGEAVPFNRMISSRAAWSLSPKCPWQNHRRAQGGNREAPSWPRSVRIAVDYALRVAISDVGDMKEAEAASYARMCCTLGALQARDPPGDPPATCSAQETAANAGKDYGRAVELLGHIRDSSARMLSRGVPVQALPAPTMRLMQRAARGESVSDDDLKGVLEAAQRLQDRLGFPAR